MIESGKASLTGRLRLEGETASGDVSFLLEALRLRGDRDRPLFGLPAETSEEAVSGINRYAEELPIVFGSRIGGSADAPTLEWEAPLLEVAREGLLMIGKRELESTIEELGLRIEGLGGLEGVPISPNYEELQATTKGAASRIIEEATGELIEDFLVPAEDTESARSSDVVDPTDLLPGLLEKLLRPEHDTEDGDDSETEAP